MSYCKINIGGKERGLKFNQLAILILQQKIGKDIPVESAAYALIYGGLRANCFVKEDEPDFDFEKVCEWVERVSDTDMAKVNAAFQETEAYKKSEAFKQDEKASKSKKKSPMKNTPGNA